MSVAATHHLHAALAGPDAPGLHSADSWRWQTRRLLAEQRDRLSADSSAAYDGWLAARGAGMVRERDTLLARLAGLGSRLAGESAIEDIRADLWRLLVDVEHHLQRRRDLVWDEVELELGGSE